MISWRQDKQEERVEKDREWRVGEKEWEKKETKKVRYIHVA